MTELKATLARRGSAGPVEAGGRAVPSIAAGTDGGKAGVVTTGVSAGVTCEGGPLVAVVVGTLATVTGLAVTGSTVTGAVVAVARVSAMAAPMTTVSPAGVAVEAGGPTASAGLGMTMGGTKIGGSASGVAVAPAPGPGL